MLRDLHFAVRRVIREPGFALLAVFTLALGLAGTTAMFAAVNAAFLKPLPFPSETTLMRVYERTPQSRQVAVGLPVARAWITRTRSALAVAAYLSGTEVNVSDGHEASRALLARVTGQFFPAMAVAPVEGRAFSPEDLRIGAEPTAIISYTLWQRLLGGRPAALAQPLLVEGARVPIIGVMPEGFSFPDNTSIWMNLEREGPDAYGDSTAHNFTVVARLRPGIAPPALADDLSGIIRSVAETDPRLANEHPAATVVPLRTDLLGTQASVIFIGLGAVFCVLLIACVNVINLMLARSVSMDAETGIRLALGASRFAVARAVVAEGLVLSLAGALAGGAAGAWATHLIASITPATVTDGQGLSLDWRVAVLVALVTTAAGVVCGWLPALRTSRVDVRQTLAAGGRTLLAPPLRVMRTLVGIEAGLAVVLLFGAGLLARTYHNLDRVDLGFRAQGVMTASASLGFLPASPYANPLARRDYFAALDAAARTLPGVTSVGLTAIPPLGFSPNGQFEVQGSRITSGMHYRLVGGDYFRTLDIPVRRGRAFTRDDDAAHPLVAVVNEALARTVFKGADPIGQLIRMPGMDGGDEAFSTIVGVVGDLHDRGPERPPDPEAYFVYLQRPQRTWVMTLVVTATTPAAVVVGQLRDRARAIDASVPLAFGSLEDRLARVLEPTQFRASLLGTLGLVALALAAIGLVGVAAYGAARRRAEIGLRMALGATPGAIQWLFLRTGVGPIAIGGGGGILAALFLSRTLAQFLFGVDPHDGTTLGAACGVLIVCGFLANWWPARRASRVDPMRVLRS
jgi:putative ABC transport system permease protein